MRKLFLLLANYSVLFVFIMCVTSCGDKLSVEPLDDLVSPGGVVITRASITNFLQTGSHFKKNGFSYEGKTYDYKYDAWVTVQTGETHRRVIDWGYVYVAPNGKTTHISLKDFNSPYTDTHFVYYSNEDKSTVTLYEYDKQEGDRENYYGKKNTYELIYEEPSVCPDSNHPHMMDLDLPSGTKWACCNVDTDHPASQSPVNFGGYYAWGETETKLIYDWITYKYCDGSESSCHNLGSDIAGTQYDVAHVKWGGRWQMPTVEQMKELIDYCTYKWTTENGVRGGKFTSKKNGVSIFLPAAGAGGNLNSAGEYGLYWSSTHSSALRCYACNLYVLPGYADSRSESNYRFSGQSVRPIVKN